MDYSFNAIIDGATSSETVAVQRLSESKAIFIGQILRHKSWRMPSLKYAMQSVNGWQLLTTGLGEIEIYFKIYISSARKNRRWRKVRELLASGTWHYRYTPDWEMRKTNSIERETDLTLSLIKENHGQGSSWYVCRRGWLLIPREMLLLPKLKLVKYNSISTITSYEYGKVMMRIYPILISSAMRCGSLELELIYSCIFVYLLLTYIRYDP